MSDNIATAAPDIVVSLLGGLLKLTADPNAGARFAALAALRSKVIEAEQRLQDGRVLLAERAQTVRGELAKEQAALTESREKTEGQEAMLDHGKEVHAAAALEWRGLGFPHEAPHRLAALEREGGDANGE